MAGHVRMTTMLWSERSKHWRLFQPQHEVSATSERSGGKILEEG
jgi:hypothetical protein